MTQDTDDLLRLDRQICFPLYAASNLMTRLYRPLLAQLGLTYPQYLVMMVLWETPNVSMSALCERLYLDSGTLSPLLRRLEQHGLLTRSRDQSDERRLLIRLTDAGLALKAKARAVPEALRQLFGAPDGEVDEFRAAVRAVAKLLAEKLHGQTSPEGT